MIKAPNNSTRLLSRQLKKSFPNGEFTEHGINDFIKHVNDAYISIEEERDLRGRAEKIANKELEEVNKELQTKNDFLDTFNYGMAHDIKNHTSNIIGLISMLQKYTLKQNIEMITQITEKLDLSANQLTSIVQGFLYLSRAESKIDNQYKIIDKEELKRLIELEIQFLSKGKDVTIDYHFNLNGLFYSRHILKIILVNLISNSIKYSKPNKPCVIGVNLSNNENTVTLSVEDNGIGIDLEKSEKKLYNLFNQINRAEEKGFGVGLFLIKKMVDRNNGIIHLTSQLDEGTKIEINLPITN